MIEVNHVSEESPAPDDAETSWSVYGHDGVNGGVFWIADFPFAEHKAAMELAGQLEGMWAAKVEADKEVARLTECLETPVGYVNQNDLEILRSTGEVQGVSACVTACGHHNVAIYAQD